MYTLHMPEYLEYVKNQHHGKTNNLNQSCLVDVNRTSLWSKYPTGNTFLL